LPYLNIVNVDSLIGAPCPIGCSCEIADSWISTPAVSLIQTFSICSCVKSVLLNVCSKCWCSTGLTLTDPNAKSSGAVVVPNVVINWLFIISGL
jgi:hypothetical protein